MTVSELARRSGVSAHRIRRYEALGLIRAERSASGYRRFSDASVRELVFVSMSRDLGFSIKEIAETLPRYRARTLTFADMVALLHERIDAVDRQIAAQRVVRRKLVAHVAWMKRREQAAAKRSPRPSFPSPTKRRSP